MNKKIESFLQDIQSLPDEKLDKKALEANLEMLLSASPEIKADQAFKDKLHTRLNTIVEFKQWNKAVRKIWYLKVLFPIFACLVLAVWVFSMVDIKLFNWDTSNITPLQSESNIPEPSENISNDADTQETTINSIQEEKPLTVKERILAQAAERKVNEKNNTSSINWDIETEEVNLEESSTETDTSAWDDDDIVIKENSEASDDVGSDKNNAAAFSTQLRWSEPINDTPWVGINIASDANFVADEVLPDFIEELLDDDNSQDWEDLQTNNTQEASEAEDSEIAIEIFTQSCEAFEWTVETQSGSMICVKQETNICSRVDYENMKCDFLE